MFGDQSRDVERRDFIKAAVAIGGSSALSACLDRESELMTTETGTDSFPAGTDPASLPTRQHAWNDYLVRNAHGNTTLPVHQLILGLSYEGSTPPTDEERDQVRRALASLERAYQWGTGGDEGTKVNGGLLSMLGYAPQYFERVGDPVDVTPPEEVLEAVGEDPSDADGFDAVLVLSSDWGSLLLAAEQALFGEKERLNGVSVEGTFEGVFSQVARRSGVVGKGIVARKLDTDAVPEDAPLSMGFRSGFVDNQATEDRVTLQDGHFAGGTTMQVSRLHIDVDRWHDRSDERQVTCMFSPDHDLEQVGSNGDKLGNSSGLSPGTVDDIPEHAAEHGCIGHSQKVARARDEDFRPRILRRSEGVATDVASGAGFNFSSIQHSLEAFVDARAAMRPDEHDVDVPDENHGIVDFLETRARGTYLVPPRDKRALPTR